jgi:hypothetical protein
MRADKNSSRRRPQLQQDELGRTPKITRSALNLPFAKTTCHWSATGPRDKHYQQPQLLHAHGSGNNLGAGCLEGAVRPPPPGDLEIPPKLLFRAPRHLMVSPAEISSQGQSGYQEIMVKTKTSPRGLGAVRPATRGGLTSCTQQRTPSKNS